MITHYSKITWNKNRWPNFSAKELACPCCGEYYHDPASLDMIQKARTEYGAAFRINSAHRCILHNARVGGAPLSQHKKIAFDISIRGKDHKRILQACKAAGFSTFGFYGTFLHTDIRPGRKWATKSGRIKWI